MKRQILIAMAFLAISFSFADEFNCTLVNGSCGDSTSYYILNNYTNAHVAQYNYSSANYTWNLCCDGPSLSRGCDESIIFNMNNYTNAHVSFNNYSQGNYTIPSCISSDALKSDVYCEYAASCPQDWTCMGSLPDIAREYSLHAANCSEYSIKICCLITELSSNLKVEGIAEKNAYVENSPEVWVTVKNYGNRTAFVYNATLETSENYVIVQIPEYIPPNSIATFIFRFARALCSDYNSRVDYLMEVVYKKNDEETSALYQTGDFYIGNPISVSSASGVVGMTINDILRIPLVVRNMGGNDINYGLTIYTTDLFVTLERNGEVYTKGEANSESFSLDVADSSTLSFLAPYALEETVTVFVQHSSCSYANQTVRFIVKSLTNVGGLINLAVSPGLDMAFIALLGMIGAVLSVSLSNKSI